MFGPEYLEDFIKKNKCYSVIQSKQYDNIIYKKCEKFAYYSEDVVKLYDELQLMKIFILFGLIIVALLYYELIRFKRDVLKHRCFIEKITDVLSERIDKNIN